jgi:putative aldouronate transport system permease protein
MNSHLTASSRWFTILNYSFLALVSFLCLFPLIHIFALSFSSNTAVAAGRVVLWPVEFTTVAYQIVLKKPEFAAAFMITFQRVILGVSINMLMTILIAYPLSKESKDFRFRTACVWFFVVTILFHGGLIPSYLVVKETGIIDTIWALVLPGAVPVFNVVLLLNFFRGLPKELEEAAFIDGAGHWQTLWRIFVPLSAPALATVTLFAAVGHWNEWFSALIYINKMEHYPLQSYLRTIIMAKDIAISSTVSNQELEELSDRTAKATQIFLGALPILCIYPFLQRFFIKGIVLGSVKG